MADPGGPPPTVALAPTPADDVTILEAAIAAPVLGLGGTEEASLSKSTELFRHLFETLDLKQDGRIDADELVVGLHNMGYLHLSQERRLVAGPFIS